MKVKGVNLLGGGGTFIEGSPCMLNVFCALIIDNDNNDNDNKNHNDKSDKSLHAQRL